MWNLRESQNLIYLCDPADADGSKEIFVLDDVSADADADTDADVDARAAMF